MNLKERQELIGERIKEMRVEKRLTQSDLATKMSEGQSTERGKSTISEYEHGKHLTLENIQRISEILPCDMNYLLGCQKHPDVNTSWIAERIPLGRDAIQSLEQLNETVKNKDSYTYLDGYNGILEENADFVVGMIDWFIRGICWRVENTSLLERISELKEACKFSKSIVSEDGSLQGDYRMVQASDMAILVR